MAVDSGDRRAFLRDTLGKLAREMARRTEAKVVQRRWFRPPGARPEIEFLTACTRCGACVDICPAHAIRSAPPTAGLAAGTPVLEPSIQACIVCADIPCARACPTGALVPPPAGWDEVRLGVLSLDVGRCITFHGSSCGVCARACPIGERALAMDAQGHPVLKPEACVGCGVCVTACVTAPSSLALAMKPGDL